MSLADTVSGWDGVVWASALAAIAATALQAVALRRGPDVWQAWSRRMAWTSAAFAALAFAWLVGRFIVADVSIGYVFLYTATDVPLAYRIAGAWTGREGSLLLWALYTVAVAAVAAALDARRRGEDGATRTARAWTRLLLLAVAALFLVVSARQGTFQPTDPFFLQGRPGGNGINPTLRNPYILIHPPMMFLAYALTAVPLAAGLAHMVTGTARWSAVAATGSRVNWLLYTFAMGLGGLWAYYTLGFGGYWAWDPVEVANFLPWLALTVYLHAQLRHRRDGGFALIGPFLAVLPFLFTVFSTVSTRSGLWVSVHAFTDPTNAFEPDAAQRLLDIVDADPSLLPYAGMLAGVLLAALALWNRRLAIDLDVMPRASRAIAAVLGGLAVWAFLHPVSLMSGLFQAGHMIAGGRTGLGSLGLVLAAGLAGASPALVAPEEEGSGRRRDILGIPSLLFVSVLLLSLVLVITTLFHLAAVNGWDRRFWEARVPWITTPVALALIVLLLRSQRGKQVAIGFAVASLGAAAAAYLAFDDAVRLGAYAVVLSVAVLVAAVDKTASVSFVGDRRAKVASGLLWGAAVLDIVFWINPPTVLPGGLSWEVRWPWQVPFLAASVVALVAAHRVGIGAERRAWPYVLAGLLGAFYITPVLAGAAWILHRRSGVRQGRWTWRRLRPVGVYGVHLAVAVLFLGYSTSTYFADAVREDLEVGASGELASYDLRYDGATMQAQPGTPWASEVHPRFTLIGAGGPVAEGHGILYWEPTTGSHYPLPHTMRLWHRDVYVSIEGVCTGDDCPADGWTDAYQRSNRIGYADQVEAVRVQALSLPGVSLVWTSLALFVAYAVPVIFGDRPKVRG